MEQVKKILEFAQPVDLKDAYLAGFECGMLGPNSKNCSFRFFTTPDHAASWERGKTSGELARARIESPAPPRSR